MLNVNQGKVGPKGDPGKPGGIDHQIDPFVEDRAPSQAVVHQALMTKQDVIESSDEIQEGSENLYFTPERAAMAVLPEVFKFVCERLSLKQDQISSSDQIAEGQSHLYFTHQRALAAIQPFVESHVKQAIASQPPVIQKHVSYSDEQASEAAFRAGAIRLDAVTSLTDLKHNKMNSTDDLPEGGQNLYFSQSRVKETMHESIEFLWDVIAKLRAKIDAQADQIQEVKKAFENFKASSPTSARGAFSGKGTGSLMAVSFISKSKVKYQSLQIKDGLVVDISPESEPKALL